jgi:DNA-binding response OmpR family regulator
MKILLIDDCADIVFLVEMSLMPHDVHHVGSVAEARAALEQETFDLLLIDGALPDGDGFRVCRELSQKSPFASVPKIILTARSEIEDKVLGFNCGADDYVTKPFAAQELKARVEARLKNRGADAGALTRWSCFEFESDFQRCWVVNESGRTDLQVTPTEYRILLALARRRGSPLTRDELVSEVWKSNGLHIEKRGVDSHIAHLRKKMGAQGPLLQSVYGKGYALVSEASKAFDRAA